MNEDLPMAAQASAQRPAWKRAFQLADMLENSIGGKKCQPLG